MRLFLFLITIVLLSSCSQDPTIVQQTPVPDTLGTGWNKVTLDTKDFVTDIFFVNNTTGFCTCGPFIYRSSDGGNSWQKVYQATHLPGISLANIAMGSVNNVIFTYTNSNQILFTKNGGYNFDSTLITPYQYITDAFFVNPSTAYAVGKTTWKTTNAGTSWTNVSSFTSDTVYDFKSLFFLDEQTGWVTGGGLFKTSNACASWQRQSTPGLSIWADGAVYFSDVNNGYVTDRESVLKTTNGGANFSKIFQSSTQAYHDVHFVTQQTGYVSDAKYLWKTTDGGQTWNKEVVFNDGIGEIHFTDASHGWAGCAKGVILKYAP
jgi:photosystem II stability/assembly factor-like uncharacterized protein